ncbi:SH3 domain-binding glutamic acid-rich protein homolog [Tribolium madens]|uniref:SH3 domain-binding glutamic acid-rich protein homolog n=1 Tax=Tribolium madens TaxID=41895 RepID=UPI001CF73ECA|nr:SH3 domain-binding glutamic acid-rich protein homolog [Tribolium madens]
MGVKVYFSSTSADIEVKQRQKRVFQILDAKNVKYKAIDITQDENKTEKEFMQNNAKNFGATSIEPTPIHPVPPQIFNDDGYCGDYEQFEMANENSELKEFLKLTS